MDDKNNTDASKVTYVIVGDFLSVATLARALTCDDNNPQYENILL